MALSQVSYVSVDSDDATLFSFFSNDLSSRLITCHTLRLANARQSNTLFLSINESFKINNGEVQLKDSNIKRHLSVATSKRHLRRTNSATNAGRELGRFETQWLGEKCLKKPIAQVIS